jgi:hypothetical protein
VKYYLGDQIKTWERHIASMGVRRGANRDLVGKPEGKKPLGRPRRRWEDNINMDIQEAGWVSMDWTDLAKERHSWQAVKAVMNLKIP